MRKRVLNKYNYVYERNGVDRIFSINSELDDHLRRHLNLMASNDKRNDTEIVRWLKKRGFKEALVQ